MNQAVLIDIDPLLAERIQRIATAHGWDQQQSLTHLIEHGLFALEADLASRFGPADAQALQLAIAALRDIPDDPGFALIGRSAAPGTDAG